MNADIKIPFERLDFALPIQRFRIEYSLVEKNSVPFVREFVLRLLLLTKMTLGELAAYMGFTPKEVRAATKLLFEANEIMIGEEGRIELTQKAKTYFRHSTDESPRIAQLSDRRDTFRFDLVSFGYVPKSVGSDDWRFAIKLEPDIENRSQSALFARKAFQRCFYKIYNDENLSKYNVKGNEIPDIYKVSDVSPQGEDYVKLPQTLYLNTKTGAVDRSEIEHLEDQNDIIEKITDAITSSRQSENIHSVLTAMQDLGGEFLLDCFSSNGFDFPKFMLGVLNERGSSMDAQRIFGSLLLSHNWDRVVGLFRKHTQSSRVKKDSTPEMVTWLAPSSPFWGRAGKIQECISTILGFSTESKSNQKVFDFSLKLPLQGKEDWSAKKFQLEYKEFRSVLYGYVEGYYQGIVEMIIYPGRFAVVLFHVVPPISSVPIPLGYVTEDKTLVAKLDQSLKEYLFQPTGCEGNKDLGPISTR